MGVVRSWLVHVREESKREIGLYIDKEAVREREKCYVSGNIEPIGTV